MDDNKPQTIIIDDMKDIMDKIDDMVKTVDGRMIPRANAAFGLTEVKDIPNTYKDASGKFYVKNEKGEIRRLTPKKKKRK